MIRTSLYRLGLLFEKDTISNSRNDYMFLIETKNNVIHDGSLEKVSNIENTKLKLFLIQQLPSTASLQFLCTIGEGAC